MTKVTFEQLTRMSLAQLRAAYVEGRCNALDVMEMTLDQVFEVNPQINALYDLQPEAALKAAQQSTERYHRGVPCGPLDGMPVTLKDSVHAEGMRWHHGSKAHGMGLVGVKDAPPTERLKAAGAIVIGKCTMPDYGLSASGVSSFHGIVRNPWGLDWNTGGSSAGAGASLAAGIGAMSVGTDIAGSVRLPASHCGLAAIKPTQGMLAHTPASDVRSPGPMARQVADLEPLLRILGGAHQDDRFSVPVTEPSIAGSLRDLRVAVFADFGFGPPLEPAVLRVFGQAEAALAVVVDHIFCPAKRYSFDAYLPIDQSLQLRGWREYSAAAPDFREQTPRQLVDWFIEARDWTADHVATIERGLVRGIDESASLFDGVDFLLTPVMPIVNFAATELGIDRLMPLRHCTFTAPFNQSGHPAVSLCAGHDARGLPVGVQIVGRRFDDIRLLRLATALEQVLWLEGRPENYWPLQPRQT
jgi:Asp-tRNA(Asn)/Glu-tRNA(Gln) amidotransferase A subunit family amidase